MTVELAVKDEHMQKLIDILSGLDPDTKLIDPVTGDEWDAANLAMILGGGLHDETCPEHRMDDWEIDGIGIIGITRNGMRADQYYVKFDPCR